jgi:8-oxo-dGTP diphosphatase
MRESHIHRIEVHVSGICFYYNQVLIAKRSPSRNIYPGYWECSGGQVKAGESFDESVLRQLKEELGVIAEIIKPFKTYEIPVPDLEQKKIPGLRFACNVKRFVNSRSPEISDEHTEWKLLAVSEIGPFSLIPGLKEDIIEAYALYLKGNAKTN